MEDFLRDLRAKRAGDLNAVLTTLNDGGLCREAVHHWVGEGWIVLSPSTPLHALAGPNFSRELSLRRFCGEPQEISVETGGIEEAEETEGAEQPQPTEEPHSDEDQ